MSKNIKRVCSSSSGMEYAIQSSVMSPSFVSHFEVVFNILFMCRMYARTFSGAKLYIIME